MHTLRRFAQTGDFPHVNSLNVVPNMLKSFFEYERISHTALLGVENIPAVDMDYEQVTGRSSQTRG